MPHFSADWDIEFRQLRNRLQEIYERIFMPCQPVPELFRCVTGAGKGPESIPREGWEPFSLMDRWGGFDQTTWFRMRVATPAAFAGKRVVALLNPCAHTHVTGAGPHDESGEGLAYVNGRPRQGIDRNHGFMVLTEKGRAGEMFDIALECCPSTRFDASHVFSRADLAVMNMPLWEFYWDGWVYLDVVRELPDNSTTRLRLFSLVRDAIFQVDLQQASCDGFMNSVAKASRFLRKGLRDFPAEAHSGALMLMGHSHIDTAWLWPLRETRRKVGRTFATVLRLMDQYPEYHFSASQPELYMFVKENHPELWKGIKRRVKEGRWEPCGASWVEQDSNMPCGESLVRQLLLGNRFYEREFGRRSTVAWLPDAFGFPWSLPQLLVKAGIKTFHTIKISWSQYTTFPFGYFMWQGIDGTRIRAVMPPLNYNGNPVPGDCIRQWDDFAQKHLVDIVPFSFGFGDGGGGPTVEMLEYGKRLADVSGVPRCEFGSTEACYERMEAGAPETALPVHNGELYLELHRACQTTQARTKRNNRKCEWLLHTTEWLCAMASRDGFAYDHDAINQAWRVLLTQQFHDILPGSSITEVYSDADRNYAAIRGLIEPLLTQAQGFLATSLSGEGAGVPLVVWNPLGWTRTDAVEMDVSLPADAFHVLASDGAPVPAQRTGDGRLLFLARDVPALGCAVFRLLPGPGPEMALTTLHATAKQLENAFVQLKMDTQGRFKGIYDKRFQRDVLAPGQVGNVLQLFDDRPASNDAWDVDFNFDQRVWEPDKGDVAELVECGPVRAVVRVTRRTAKSVFTQNIVLYAHSARIDVDCHVDWHEKRCLLKVAFPVDILSARATYHIQFGAIERATHANTAFDHARFEVTAQHWADLSEAGYGVSLLNDCKYGYDVRDNVLRLSLLRAPVDPDPCADEGEHRFTYALLPHGGDWREETVRHGYGLNAPLLAHVGENTSTHGASAMSLCQVDQPNIIIETVKKAEDQDALVVRLYEAHGGRCNATLRFDRALSVVEECSLMEDRGDVLPLSEDNAVLLHFRPYEIRSLLIYP